MSKSRRSKRERAERAGLALRRATTRAEQEEWLRELLRVDGLPVGPGPGHWDGYYVVGDPKNPASMEKFYALSEDEQVGLLMPLIAEYERRMIAAGADPHAWEHEGDWQVAKANASPEVAEVIDWAHHATQAIVMGNF